MDQKSLKTKIREKVQKLVHEDFVKKDTQVWRCDAHSGATFKKIKWGEKKH